MLERHQPPQTSRIKCLECSWKWWSKRKYVGGLKDHKERSRSGLTDLDILDHINEGQLVADFETGVIRTNKKRLTIIERESNGSSYNFVNVCRKGKKKKIAVHRLVWIAYHNTLPPDGFDVDHKHGKKVKYPDGITNLRLLESSKNRSNRPEDF